MDYSSTTNLTEKVPTISGMTSFHAPRQMGNGDLAPSLIAGISSIPMQLFSEGNKITDKERHFLEAAEKGDKASVERCLLPPDPVNVNVTNLLGRSALQMAVDNENIEIVELLLAQTGIDIGDALLQAIREGVYRMVEMMVNHPSISRQMLGEGWSSAYRSKRKESSDYSPDISPVILAAHCNQFEILQLLLTRGATINKPHSVVCVCVNCSEKQKEDSLRYSLDRINCFRALASPAWISLTNSDPILAAFKLSWELHMLSIKENEFKDIFTTLEAQTKLYAVDLLEQCRTTEEVIAVLNKESDEDDQFSNDRIEEGQIALTRFKLALKYDQKQVTTPSATFPSHPHAQQLLASIWYDGFPGWRRRHLVTKVVICFGLSCLLPFMAIYYLILPRSKIGQLMRSPFMKFMNHSASFIFFLGLLVYASIHSIPCHLDKRGRGLDWVEATIMVFAFGMIWAECKQLWEEGLKAYIRQWWNWLDFIMLSLYLTTFTLRFATMYLVQTGRDGYNSDDPRREWPKDDPTLLAEGIFSIANVFSFARIIFLFQVNPYLGPLQISLGCMLIDIFKFLLIFFLVLLSFACGMNKLYSNDAHTVFDKDCYSNTTVDAASCNEQTGKEFAGLTSAIRSLIWALVGLINRDVITNRDPSIAVFGEILFLSYQLVAIIVLINMLIAMMSSSFQNIENHADVEWKFARSKLWMSYFDEGSTLPPPLNLVISPKSMYSCYQHLKKLLCSRMIKSRKMSKISKRDSLNGTFKHTDSSQPSTVTPDLRYQDVMKRLVSRYIHLYKAKQKADGVNEDDLNEIKQDISSLRYELREDRKREEARGKLHFDDIKKDIVNALQVKEMRRDKMTLSSTNRGDSFPLRRNDAIDTDSTSTGSDSRKSPRMVRSASNIKRVKQSYSVDPTMDYQQKFTDGFKRNMSPVSPSNVSRLSTEQYISKRDLEEMKRDIVGSLTEEIHRSLSTNIPPPRPLQPRTTHSYHPHVFVERSDSPLPPTPPPKPKNFRPIHSNIDVDIHGIRQRASSPGIRYHLSPGPPMYDTTSDPNDGSHSFTQL
ncbi:Transient-receptor-potential-like protein [Holothuria leucospilota]|uniref:Transient-receptor-potential-like protein n=1 Tax=Holothuria leucospilota TaxID=206669 RepID=A0A9Q1BKE4_HOLLE|nr:Transient-receptor-potential-like protein [Holothuria leucospilota]